MTLVKNGVRFELTPKQARFLEFVLQYQVRNGYSPTQAEIAQALGFRSLNSVQNYLNILREKGALEKERDTRREVTVNHDLYQKLAQVVRISLLGKVAAGRPIEAVEDSQPIEVPSSFIKPGAQYFALEVRGDSMIEDHICDGDHIVVRSQETAKNGDRVVALVDNEATLKRYEQKGGKVILHPANPAFNPIEVRSDQSFRIAGIYVGLMRRA